jgi:enoyl-CoA hydratase/carnithine racemase
VLGSTCLTMEGCSGSPYIHHYRYSNGQVGLITLDRPESLNALDLSMVDAMYTILLAWKNEFHRCGMPRVVMVMAQTAFERYILHKTDCWTAGKKRKSPFFCAGGDVKQIVQRGSTSNDVQWGIDYFHREYFLDHLISEYPIPYIAVMDGITFGGGVGLSIHGTYQIATENTVFAMPECAIGLFPDIGGSYFLPRLNHGLGMYLGLTGDRVFGKDVKFVGLATHYIHSSMLSALLGDLIRNDLVHEIDGANLSKFLHKYEENTKCYGDGDVSHELTKQHILQHIKDVFGDHATSVESIMEACESVANDCAFFERAKDAMKTASPLSLKITFEQLRRGRMMPLIECFRMDNRIIRRLTRDTSSDFYIGVRAKLLSKSRSPRWTYTSLRDVSDALVSSYFAPLSPEDELQLSCRHERMKRSSL